MTNTGAMEALDLEAIKRRWPPYDEQDAVAAGGAAYTFARRDLDSLIAEIERLRKLCDMFAEGAQAQAAAYVRAALLAQEQPVGWSTQIVGGLDAIRIKIGHQSFDVTVRFVGDESEAERKDYFLWFQDQVCYALNRLAPHPVLHPPAPPEVSTEMERLRKYAEAMDALAEERLSEIGRLRAAPTKPGRGERERLAKLFHEAWALGHENQRRLGGVQPAASFGDVVRTYFYEMADRAAGLLRAPSSTVIEQLDEAIRYAEYHNHSGISLEEAKEILAALCHLSTSDAP